MDIPESKRPAVLETGASYGASTIWPINRAKAIYLRAEGPCGRLKRAESVGGIRCILLPLQIPLEHHVS